MSAGLKRVGDQTGFTLMEVLIAITITGISIGVIMSVLAQGHRQLHVASLHRKAGEVANIIFAQVQPSWQPERLSKAGDIESYPDWTYQIERGVTIVEDEEITYGVREFEIEELEEIKITVLPPEGEPKFVFTRYMPAEMSGQAIGPSATGGSGSAIFGGANVPSGGSSGSGQTSSSGTNPFLDILMRNR